MTERPARVARAGSESASREHAFGFGVMAGSSVVFSVLSLLIRVAKEIPGVTPYHTTLFRFSIGAAFVFGYSALRRQSLRVVNLPWLIARGLLGGVAVLIYFYSIPTIGLAKGTVLNYTYPLWASLFAPFVIRERIRPGLWFAVLAAFLGLYFLISPTTDLSGVTPDDLLALLGGLTAGFAILAIKHLRETDSSLTIFLSQSLFGLAMIAYPAAGRPFSFSIAGWVLLIVIGFVATFGQLLMTYAFKHVSGTEGALLGFLVPLLNSVLGIVVFREPVSGRMLMGGAIVLAACAYAAVSPLGDNGEKRAQPVP